MSVDLRYSSYYFTLNKPSKLGLTKMNDWSVQCNGALLRGHITNYKVEWEVEEIGLYIDMCKKLTN